MFKNHLFYLYILAKIRKLVDENQLNGAEMKEIEQQLNNKGNHIQAADSNNLPDFLLYPPEDDIYSKCQRVKDIDLDSISRKKRRHEISQDSKVKQGEPEQDTPEYYLDLEVIETAVSFDKSADNDGENSYYSMGNDNHKEPESDDS